MPEPTGYLLARCPVHHKSIQVVEPRQNFLKDYNPSYTSVLCVSSCNLQQMVKELIDLILPNVLTTG